MKCNARVRIQILHKCTILQSNTQYNAIQWSQYTQSTQLTHQVSTQFTQLIRIGTVYTSDTPSVGTVYTVDTPSIKDSQFTQLIHQVPMIHNLHN